jgi:hypothetical protein
MILLYALDDDVAVIVTALVHYYQPEGLIQSKK